MQQEREAALFPCTINGRADGWNLRTTAAADGPRVEPRAKDEGRRNNNIVLLLPHATGGVTSCYTSLTTSARPSFPNPSPSDRFTMPRTGCAFAFAAAKPAKTSRDPLFVIAISFSARARVCFRCTRSGAHCNKITYVSERKERGRGGEEFTRSDHPRRELRRGGPSSREYTGAKAHAGRARRRDEFSLKLLLTENDVRFCNLRDESATSPAQSRQQRFNSPFLYYRL